jgi:hypothetical protein
MLTQTVHEWISVLEDMFEAQTQTLQTVKAWGSFQLAMARGWNGIFAIGMG